MSRTPLPSQPVLFPTGARRPRPVPGWRQAFMEEFGAAYHARYQRFYRATDFARLGRDYKRWVALVPEAALRVEMAREYLRSTDAYLEDHGHPFHLMLQQGRVNGLIHRATVRVEERAARDRKLQFHAESVARERARMAEADAADRAAAAAAGLTVEQYRTARTATWLRRLREINLHGRARA